MIIYCCVTIAAPYGAMCNIISLCCLHYIFMNNVSQLYCSERLIHGVFAWVKNCSYGVVLVLLLFKSLQMRKELRQRHLQIGGLFKNSFEASFIEPTCTLQRTICVLRFEKMSRSSWMPCRQKETFLCSNNNIVTIAIIIAQLFSASF